MIENGFSSGKDILLSPINEYSKSDFSMYFECGFDGDIDTIEYISLFCLCKITSGRHDCELILLGMKSPGGHDEMRSKDMFVLLWLLCKSGTVGIVWITGQYSKRNALHV